MRMERRTAQMAKMRVAVFIVGGGGGEGFGLWWW